MFEVHALNPWTVGELDPERRRQMERLRGAAWVPVGIVFWVRRDNASVLRLINRRLKRHVTASLEMVVATKALAARTPDTFVALAPLSSEAVL